MKTLEEMQAEVVAVNARHDWGNGEPVPWRRWGVDDATKPSSVIYGVGLPEQGEAVVHKPEGVGSEFADIFIRLLDNCAVYGIDLRAEYERKIAYNRTRPVKHGGKRA